MPRLSRQTGTCNCRRLLIGCAVAVCALLCHAAFAVVAPYAANFDSYSTGSTPADFTTQTTGFGLLSGQWQVENASGSAGVYRNSGAGPLVQSSAAISVTNLVDIDFTLSTTFVVNGFGVLPPPGLSDISVGLAALASSRDFSTSGYQLSYELLNSGSNFTGDGALQLYRANQFVARIPITGVPWPSLPVATGVKYTMTLTGTYSPSGLLLTGTLSNGTTSVSTSATDPNPPQGTDFGYFDHAQGQVLGAVNVDVSYDNFSIAAVPEVPTVWFLFFGALILGTCRRLGRI